MVWVKRGIFESVKTVLGIFGHSRQNLTQNFGTFSLIAPQERETHSLVAHHAKEREK